MRLGLVVIALVGCAYVRPPAIAIVGDTIEDPMPPEQPIQRRPAADARRSARPIRVAVAPRIREVSAAGLVPAPLADSPLMRSDLRAQLRAPHREAISPPLVLGPSELRTLVGLRDARAPVTAAVAWARDLGIEVEATSGAELVAWAEHTGRLRSATESPERGDLLVFDRVFGDDAADLVAIVISRDERDVTELLYLGGGVIRRGFVDAKRPRIRRDRMGAVVNTYLRTGKRWPPKGTRYLAGELLAHVIRGR